MRSFRWVSVGFAIVLSASCSNSAPPTVAEVDNACRRFSGFDENLSDFVIYADFILLEQGFDQNTIDESRDLARKQVRISWETLQRYDRAYGFLALMRKKLVDPDFPEQLQEFNDRLSGGNDLDGLISKVNGACMAISLLRSDGLLPADE
jgi:hypothetical protein